MALRICNLRHRLRLSICSILLPIQKRTACAFLQLEAQGQIHLNSKAINYIPELQKHIDPHFKEITIRDLLTHRSGIFRDGVDSIFWELQKPFLSRHELLEEVLSAHLVYTPNSVTKYSNMGYGLLGMILENKMERPYVEGIQKLILSKLPNTKIIADYEPATGLIFADGHTRSYFAGARRAMEHAAANGLASATGFCANAESTSLFFHELLQGSKLLSPQTQKEILSLTWPVKNSKTERYGLGIQVEETEPHLIGHSGSYPGFITQTRWIAGTNYMVSFFLNTNEFIPALAVKSIAALITKIKETFSNKEASVAMVTEAMMSKYRTTIHVISGTKALCFDVDTWSLCDAVLLLEQQKGGYYSCQQENGYGSVGEKIYYNKTSGNRVESVKWGSFTLHNEQTFLQQMENMST